ncbi:F-box only protein 5 [Scleropages formosus]|uniref:F-box protein 5 n=1 Tax=Scleropages formosus TaxID=113540 RepID=A0A8C9R7Z8_SCLFO|nr:F-box only protein 5 [Scleropages formosus]
MKCEKEPKEFGQKRSSLWKREDGPKVQSSPCVEECPASCQKENESTFVSNLPYSGDLDSSILDDSGYQSLHTSQIEPECGAAEHCGKWQERSRCSLLAPVVDDLSCEADHSQTKLPQLHFQLAVCKRLSENHKTNRRFSWKSIEGLAERFGLEKVIGGKMGLECVDVLQELWLRGMKHILAMILGLLADMDLINCSKVSRCWRKIISQDDHVSQRYRAAKLKLWESRQTVPMTTRDFAACRSALSCVQGLSSTPVQRCSRRTVSQKACKQSKSSSRQTRYTEFQEAASTLKQHESLKACKRCGSPAKCNPEALRATCTRQSCGFDFCTQCLREYHGSSACLLCSPASGSSRDVLVIGSSRSKRNVRRL